MCQGLRIASGPGAPTLCAALPCPAPQVYTIYSILFIVVIILIIVTAFITVALTFTGGLQGTGDTRSPLFITLVSQFAVPIGWLMVVQSMRPLVPNDIWLVIVLGHALRCALSVWRFEQGKWASISVVRP